MIDVHFCRLAYLFCSCVVGWALFTPARGEAAARDPALLFEVNYDNWNVTANFAKGDPKCLTFDNPDLQLRMYTGVGGKGGALLLANSELCEYRMRGNFDPQQGSVGLWVKPINWDWNNNKFEIFFSARQSGYRFILYKYYRNNLLAYLEYRTAQGEKKTHAARIRLNGNIWRRGRWHRLDVTWNTEGIKLYLDGRLPPERKYNKGGPTRPAVVFPHPAPLPEASVDGLISIGPLRTFLSNPHYDSMDKTAFDEVRIYSRTLSANEIRAAYEKVFPSTFGKRKKPNLLTIPKVAAPPIVLDGKLDESEWAAAALVPIADFAAHPLGGVYSRAALRHDGKTLYVAFESPVSKPCRARVAKRDGKVWEDDSFELFLFNPANRTTTHLIVNSLGTILDERNGDPKWNSHARAVAAVSAKGWSVEMALPMSDLAADRAQLAHTWKGNLCATYYRGLAMSTSAWSKPKKAYNDVSCFGRIVFGQDAVAYRLERLGHLRLGQLDLFGQIVPKSAEGRVRATATLRAEGREDVTFPGNFSGAAWSNELGPGRKMVVAEAMRKRGKQALFHYEKTFLVNRPLEIEPACLARRGIIRTSIDLNNANAAVKQTVAQRGARARVALVHAEDGRTAAETAATVKGFRTTIDLPLPRKLDRGEYRLVVTVAAGAEKLSASKPFRFPDLAVLARKVGDDHTVPTPWTPIRPLGNARYAMLNRTYTFGAGPFPVQMSFRGRQMIAEPITLRVTIRGKEYTVAWSGFSEDEVFSDLVTFHGRGTAGGAKGLAFRWTGALEFDGAWIFHLTMEPRSGETPIDALLLSYAVPEEMARFVLTPLYNAWRGDEMRLRFDTTIRGTDFSLLLANHDCGLLWWPESDANWVNPKDSHQITIRRRAERARIDIRIIERRAALRRPAEYTMAFMATPAKSPPRRWRAFHFGGWGKAGEFQNAQSISWNGFHDAPAADDFTAVASCVPRDPKAFAKALHGWAQRGITPLPYAMPAQLASIDPYYDYFIKTWIAIPGQIHDLSKCGRRYKLFACCGNTEITDLFAGRVERLCREFPAMGGLYFDVCRVRYCDNHEHGHGGIDAFGRPYVSSTALGLRRFLKRIYKILHRHGKILMNHAHSRFNPLAHSFSDYWYPGEQYTHALARNPDYFYCEDIPLEVYQSEMSARLRGVGMIFLPEYGRSPKYEPKIAHRAKDFLTNPKWPLRLIAPLVVHDIGISAAWLNRSVVNRYWGVREKTRFADATFRGYWEQRAAPPGARGVLVSLYEWKRPRPFAKVLAIANINHEAVDIDLRLDKRTLGIAGRKVRYVDLWNGRRSLTEEQVRHMRLDGNNFALIALSYDSPETGKP